MTEVNRETIKHRFRFILTCKDLYFLLIDIFIFQVLLVTVLSCHIKKKKPWSSLFQRVTLRVIPKVDLV